MRRGVVGVGEVLWWGWGVIKPVELHTVQHFVLLSTEQTDYFVRWLGAAGFAYEEEIPRRC